MNTNRLVKRCGLVLLLLLLITLCGAGVSVMGYLLLQVNEAPDIHKLVYLIVPIVIVTSILIAIGGYKLGKEMSHEN